MSVQINEFKNIILNNELSNLYILVGNETTIRDIYIKEICDRTKYTLVNLDTLEIRYINKSKTLINNNNFIYVVRYDDQILSNESVWPSLINFNNGIILLCFHSLDKRCKFYKRFEDRVVNFNKIEPKFLCKHIKMLCPDYTDDDCDYLSFLCYDDWGRIQLEIDKIKTLATIEKVPNIVAFDLLLDSNMIAERVDDDNIGFARAVVSRNSKEAIRLLSSVSRDETIGVLSLLYTMFRNSLLVKAYKGSSKGICAGTGLSYNVIQSIIPTCKAWSEEEYLNILGLIRKTIQNIKKGNISNNIALDYLLIRIL